MGRAAGTHPTSVLIGSVTDDLEHEAVRIEEVGGVVLAVLWELAGFVDDLGLLAHRPVVGLADDGAARHHERQVLQARCGTVIAVEDMVIDGLVSAVEAIERA